MQGSYSEEFCGLTVEFTSVYLKQRTYSHGLKKIPLRVLSINLFYFIKQRNIASLFSSHNSRLSWVDIHLVLLNVNEKCL